MNDALPRASADLGYVDIACAVQRFDYKPRRQGFENFNTPGLQLTIGYAKRGTGEETRLRSGKSSRVIEVDISFREQIIHSTELVLEGAEVSILAYSAEEMIIEKLRALLQQTIRDRSRRQDVYDIDWLVTRYDPSPNTRAEMLKAFLTKSASRDMTPTIESFDDPEVRRRAESEWDTMRLEIGDEKLPSFDQAFSRVVAFYRSLPWNQK